jgi:MAE_28990/MAE_18760-like HEPN
MFSSLTGQLGKEVEALKKILGVNARLRDLHAASPALNSSDMILAEVLSTAPDRINWRVFDHCAAVTRVYALYEQFVEDLVEDYLSQLPEMYSSYDDLPQTLRTQHRIGTGQILQKWSEDGPYGDLTETSVASGLVDGLRGQRAYTLLAEAFLMDPHNYRADVVVKVFGHLGLMDCLSFVKKQLEMRAFMLTRDATETPETVLRDIVKLRNQASHGSVSQDQIISVHELSSYATFIQVICGALAEMVERAVLTRRLQVCQIACVGQVTHPYSNNIVGFRCCAGQIRVGERLVAKGTRAPVGATVVSMESDRQRFLAGDLAEGQEIGLELDRKVKEGTMLMRLAPKPEPNGPLSEISIFPANDYRI